MDFASRREKLRKLVRKASASSMLVTCPVNVSYLTGFTGDSSYLWLSQDRYLLVSDGRFSQQLAEECPDMEVVIRKPNVSILKATVKVLRAEKPTTVLIEGDRVSKNEFDKLSSELKGVAFTTSSGAVESLREIKDRDELGLIRRAIEIAESGFLGLRQFLSGDREPMTLVKGVDSAAACRTSLEASAYGSGELSGTRNWTEKQVADFLENEMRQNGAISSSFRTIVGVGPRAALPHGTPSERRLCESPFVLIDWGAREGQYVSDLTRVLVTGALPPKIDRIYHTVLAAQEAGIRAIQPGALLSEIDNAARSVIAKAGFGKFFTHSLGHGFGLQVHESIRMAKGQDRPLKVGMVVTVEPGIYLPGQGGVRIEDDVLVTRDGCRLLSSLPRDLESNRLSLT
ncbi:MAG: aminopeptidase P family protein [Planctomycetota bacterium]|nr:aminopeptidase P family protein [Planctomycetota bacterium]